MFDQEGRDINKAVDDIKKCFAYVKIMEYWNSHYVKVEINPVKRARLYFNKEDIITRVRFY